MPQATGHASCNSQDSQLAQAAWVFQCFNSLVAILISMSGPDRHLRQYCWYMHRVAVRMTVDRKVVLQCCTLNNASDWVQNGTMTLLLESTSCPEPDAMLAMVFRSLCVSVYVQDGGRACLKSMSCIQ